MSKRRLKFRGLIIIVLPVLLVGLCTPASAETIRVVYYPPWNISKLPLYFARDTRIFERDGLQLSWTNPGSNEKLLTAMKNGDGDIFVVSSNHVVQNNVMGGPPLILVANTGYNYSVFLVDAMIKQPEDLKGKRIGTGELGSTPDQLTRLALRRLAIDPDKDVTLVHFDDTRSADRASALLSGQVSGSLVTAEAMYDLDKTGAVKKFRILADHKKLNIYAGGGADYAMSAEFLKNHRLSAKTFLSGICEGIALAKKDKVKALEFVGKTVRKSDTAAIEYLYRLYTSEVIPTRPYPKSEGVEVGIQMVTATVPAARGLKPEDIIDATLVQELEKEGRCNF
jgi:ABC-type nitrate/sulfonate/bicarbonate transport system substrate-binding protein